MREVREGGTERREAGSERIQGGRQGVGWVEAHPQARNNLGNLSSFDFDLGPGG